MGSSNLDKEYLESIFRAAPTGIGVVANRVFVRVNTRIEEMTGYIEAELLGKSSRMLYLSDEDYEYVGKEKYEQISKRGTGTVETRWRRKDGGVIEVLLSSTPLDLNDLSVGVTFTALDITQRKHAELEREKLQAQLLQAQKMESIGRLAGGVAHDFNNMLGAIIGYTELSLDIADDNPQLSQFLKEIFNAAQRSADLTHQLLAFARKQTTNPKVIDLNVSVSNMLNMLRRLIGENIELFWHPSTTPCSVLIDPVQIDQILANLCVNARDAISSDNGKLVIKLHTMQFDRNDVIDGKLELNGPHVVMSIQDNGHGMDPNTTAQVFEPFFTTKQVGKGTGLGLSTVYGIVKQNKGHITVYSELGKGTTFNIYFPEKQLDGVPRDDPTQLHAKTGEETILLVEDELALLNLTEATLKTLGYNVLATHSPIEAIDIVDSYKGEIDLLFSDVIMPHMNGLELSKQIQSKRPGIKQLLMSGYAADILSQHQIAQKGIQLIEKPFTRHILSEKLRDILN